MTTTQQTAPQDAQPARLPQATAGGHPAAMQEQTPQDLAGLARQHGPDCIAALLDVALNGPDSARVSAANALLDRGFGKVGQPIELAGKEGEAVQLELGVSPAVAAALHTLQGTKA